MVKRNFISRIVSQPFRLFFNPVIGQQKNTGKENQQSHAKFPEPSDKCFNFLLHLPPCLIVAVKSFCWLSPPIPLIFPRAAPDSPNLHTAFSSPGYNPIWYGRCFCRC